LGNPVLSQVPVLNLSFAMPTKKKRAFTKENSVKFLLLHGNNSAQNADGETLGNVLVPVSKNYKPGSSLLLSRITGLVNESIAGGPSEEPNLEKIIDQFDDALDSEDDEFETLKKGLNDFKNSKSQDIIVEEEYEDVDEEYEDVECSDFSDTDSDFNVSSVKKTVSFRPDCPENLKILEERMEKKLEEYEDDQLGALDDEEIYGYLTGESERVDQYIDSSLKKEEDIEIGKCEEYLKEKILKYSEEERNETYIEIVTEKPLEYDCESIISTYSNKYNHPVVIKEAGKVKKNKNS